MPSYNDALMHRAALSIPVLLMAGVVYGFDDQQNIPGGGVWNYSFTVGDAPMLVNQVGVNVVGTRNAVIQMFVGGVVTGGIEILTLFSRNHYRVGQSPFAPNSVLEGVTITTPGIEMFNIQLGAQDRNDVSGILGGALILAPNTVYYVTITNNDQTADVVFKMIASTLL